MNRVYALVALAAMALAGCASADESTTATEGVTTSSFAVQETTSTIDLVGSYVTPRDVIEAAEAGGFGCQSVSSVFDNLEEPDGYASCDLAEFESLFVVMAFTSEAERLGGNIGAMVVGCAPTMERSEPVVYVYGDDWMILSFNEGAATAQGLGDVHDLASAIGGSVNEVNCAELAETVLSIDPSRDWMDVVGELTVEELRGLLGEAAQP